MNPAIILQILQAIYAAMSAAPTVIEIANKGKELISALFSAKAISKEVQDALHASIDARAALHAAGVVDPAWTVEPDPAE